MQSLNLNHQNEVNQLLANVNELLCSPTTISNSCCCKVADLKMQVLQLRNDILVLGYGTFFRRLRQYKSMYQQLKCKICNGNADAMCEFGRQLYVNQVESIDYTDGITNFTLKEIITTQLDVLSYTQVRAFNGVTNAELAVYISAGNLLEIRLPNDVGELLIVRFEVTDTNGDLLIFSIAFEYLTIIAISIPTVLAGSGYPLSSTYNLIENLNPLLIGGDISYNGYVSTGTPSYSTNNSATLVYNNVGWDGSYVFVASYTDTNLGYMALQSQLVARQTCLLDNTQCSNIVIDLVYNELLSSYNSGTDTATLVFDNNSDYQGQLIDCIYIIEGINYIEISTCHYYGMGAIRIVGGTIEVDILNYSTFDITAFNLRFDFRFKTCTSLGVFGVPILEGDLPPII